MPSPKIVITFPGPMRSYPVKKNQRLARPLVQTNRKADRQTGKHPECISMTLLVLEPRLKECFHP